MTFSVYDSLSENSTTIFDGKWTTRNGYNDLGEVVQGGSVFSTSSREGEKLAINASNIDQ